MKKYECPICKGSGSVYYEQDSEDIYGTIEDTCPFCYGDGSLTEDVAEEAAKEAHLNISQLKNIQEEK